MRVFAEVDRRSAETCAAMALVAERERVARDVHDMFGHSLTALPIKAEIASRLIGVDPARAKAELESSQATSRQALAEIRATVGGLRSANLEAEFDTEREHVPMVTLHRWCSPTPASRRVWSAT